MKTWQASVSRILLLLCGLLLLLGTTGTREAEVKVPELSGRINAFTFDLLRQCARAEPGAANVVLSPQSVFHGLAMSYVASGGRTREELYRVVHFPADHQALMTDLARLRQQLLKTGHGKRMDFRLANGLWLDGTYAEFRQEYLKDMREGFGAELRVVKFAQADQACKEINQWIAKQTRGKIAAGIEPSDLESRSSIGVIDEPALVAVNAVYFKADWGSRFVPGATRKQPFHVTDTVTADVTMMYQQAPLAYAASATMQFLEIPYIGGDYAMYVVLPRKNLPVRELLAAVTADEMLHLQRNATEHRVDVLFPKFELRSHLRVKDALAAMGVKTVFDKQTADLDRMIIKRFEAFRVYLSQVYHDAWIDVHEEGTEAAAATTAVHFSIGCSAAPGPPLAYFHADHPFLFAIVHQESQSIVFAGWVADPRLLAAAGATGNGK